MTDNEEVMSLVDDNLMNVQNFLANRFVEAIRERVELQSKMFKYVQELMDEWILH